jgi:hypothetical protein
LTSDPCAGSGEPCDGEASRSGSRDSPQTRDRTFRVLTLGNIVLLGAGAAAAAGSSEDAIRMVCALAGTSGSGLANCPRASKRTHVSQITENDNRDILVNFHLDTRTLLQRAVSSWAGPTIHVKAALRKFAGSVERSETHATGWLHSSAATASAAVTIPANSPLRLASVIA